MIHIDKDQIVTDNENLRVMTPTGDYEDGALIEFYDVNNPDVAAGAFQAQCIKYGNMVYRFNEPAELGTAILAIDSLSTHTAASYVRMTKELLNQMNGGTLEATSLDQVITTEQANTEEAREETEPEAEIDGETEEVPVDDEEETEEETEIVPEVVPEETVPEGEVLGEEETVEEVVDPEVVPEADPVVPIVEEVVEPPVEVAPEPTTSMLIRKRAKKIV
jgi:hypothetical protein